MVSTTGMVVSLKTDLRFPESGQQGHGAQIIQKTRVVLDVNKSERHIRGGMATREKYLHQHHI